MKYLLKIYVLSIIIYMFFHHLSISAIVDTTQATHVIISEFMYRPPSGIPEYVELYNKSSIGVDLKDWGITDRTGTIRTITTTSVILQPNTYIAISADTTILRSHFPTGLFLEINRLPSLNNSGDDIVLYTNIGTTMDSLTYTTAWGGNNVAVERKNFNISSNYIENWGDSPSPQGGTPGLKNAVEVDIIPPQLTTYVIENAQKIVLSFNENLHSTLPSITITPLLQIADIQIKNNNIEINLISSMISGTTYTITITAIRDVFENQSNITLPIQYIEFENPVMGDVVINEILYDPSVDDGQFVELYNRSNKYFNLENWRFADPVKTSTLTQTYTLGPNEYVVLSDNNDFIMSIDNGYFLPGMPNLNNSEDRIRLLDHHDNTIDSMHYFDDWGGEDGYSLERIDPFKASSDPTAWQTSQNTNKHTAGIVNSIYQKDTTPPRIRFVNYKNGTLYTYFDEYVTINDNTSFIIDNVNLDNARTQGALVQFDIDLPTPNKNIVLNINNIYDVLGNVTNISNRSIAFEPLSKNTLFINEIMYDPITDNHDGIPNQREYIEIFNAAPYAISTESIRMRGIPDENGNVTYTDIDKPYTWIPSQGYAVIYPTNTTEIFDNSDFFKAFELSQISSHSQLPTYKSSLGLSSQGETIVLVNDNITLDSVHYLPEQWHNLYATSTKGISLEKIDPYGSSNSMDNWTSSVDIHGGTPFTKNSVFLDVPPIDNKTSINITPNPFSPDGDGIDEACTIQYTLDKTNYILTVRIFDRYGRLVRTLADGQVAGFNGSLIWNGSRDNGLINPIGLYVLLFEAYHVSSGENKVFKKSIAIARRF